MTNYIFFVFEPLKRFRVAFFLCGRTFLCMFSRLEKAGVCFLSEKTLHV